jgi:hypothetical protein
MQRGRLLLWFFIGGFDFYIHILSIYIKSIEETIVPRGACGDTKMVDQFFSLDTIPATAWKMEEGLQGKS